MSGLPDKNKLLDSLKRELENSSFPLPDRALRGTNRDPRETVVKTIPKHFLDAILEVVAKSIEESLVDVVARCVAEGVQRGIRPLVGEIALLRIAIEHDWDDTPQRVILVIVDYPDPKTGQLFLEPDHFFLVTSYSAQQRPAEERLEHYRQRGTFEDRLGEFRQWIGPKLTSQEFESNEATLLLSLLAFNLANMLRCELEDGAGACWDLGRFQKSVLKAGGRIVKKAHRVIVDLAQAVVPLWERLVARLQQWRLPKRYPEPRRPAYRPFMPLPRHAFLTRVIRE